VSDGPLLLERLALRLGAFRLGPLDLAVEPGAVLVLLGPNGAGKSVTLETIAGFHRIETGRILLGRRDITDLPPERRRVSLMFQSFALFPHLTAAGNVALALRAAGRPADARRVAELLERFGVAGIAARHPELLSPGEKQRVALARALAGHPALFLFDEPFSAMDGPTRAALREALRSFLRASGVPALFVTHDHAEALALADTLVLLRDGSVVQNGPAETVYRAPKTVFAAQFLGVENILAAKFLGRDGDFWRVTIAETALRIAAGAGHDMPASGISLAIRAEDVLLSPAGSEPAPLNRLDATITAATDAGALVKVTLDAGFRLVAALSRREAQALAPTPGRRITATIAPAAIRLLAGTD
jgi:ABC-type Fe3+/spermidine/putrescine transport system ATPase subunit